MISGRIKKMDSGCLISMMNETMKAIKDRLCERKESEKGKRKDEKRKGNIKKCELRNNVKDNPCLNRAMYPTKCIN